MFANIVWKRARLRFLLLRIHRNRAESTAAVTAPSLCACVASATSRVHRAQMASVSRRARCPKPTPQSAVCSADAGVAIALPHRIEPHRNASLASCRQCSASQPQRILIGLCACKHIGGGDDLMQLLPERINLLGRHLAFKAASVEDWPGLHKKPVPSLNDEVEARQPPWIGIARQLDHQLATGAPCTAGRDGDGSRRDLVPTIHAA